MQLRRRACPTACRTAAAPTCWCTTPTPSPPPPDSWGVMFEADSPADGAVSVYDSPIYIADAALYLMATQPDLGHHQPVRARPDAVRRGDRPARTSRRRSPASTGRSTPTSRRRSRAAPCSPARPGRSSSTSPRRNGAKIDAVKPKEGATGWSDTWMISCKAKQPQLHVPVDGPDHLAGGQRRGGRVVR